MIRIGTPSSTMERICTGDVCVRKQIPARKIERVVQCTCRMIFRNIQRREVMKIIFDFRTGPNAKARIPKYLFDSYRRSRHRVPPADANATTRAVKRQRHLHEVFQPVRRAAANLDVPLRLSCSAFFALLISWPAAGRSSADKALEPFEASSQLAFFAQVFDAHGIQRRQIRRTCNLGLSLLYEARSMTASGIPVRPTRQTRRKRDQLPASAAFACAAIAPNASGSCTAISASTFRSTSISARFRPLIRRL